MSDLFLTVDVGGSQTKVIYQTPGDESPRYLLMPPEVEEISESKLSEYRERLGWLGNPAPSQQAWLEVDEQVFVVGAFAHEFDPSDRLRELKYENALYKVLAAIGVIVEQDRLSVRKKLKICLGVLLPWNEYSDRKRFQSQLEVMLADYGFRDLWLKVKLERLLIRPEGSGMASIRVRSRGLDWFRQRKIGVLMLGHRNVTALYFEQGQLKKGDSPLLGFSVLLDRVVELTSGLDRERLMAAMFQGMNANLERIYRFSPSTGYQRWKVEKSHPDWQKVDPVKALATAKHPALQAAEVADLAAAIESATVDYWERLSKWLGRALPFSLDEVMISGGAASFLQPELEDYYNCRVCVKVENQSEPNACYLLSYEQDVTRFNWKRPFVEVIWGADSCAKITSVLGLTRVEKDLGLPIRLIDVFGLFDYLILSEETK